MNWYLTCDKLWLSVANWRRGKGMQKDFKGFLHPLTCMTNVVTCAFFLKTRFRAFIRFSKHLVGPLLCTHCEEPFIWALGDIERFSEDWYDLICVLEQSLVTIRTVQSPFYIRRINFNTQSTYPISLNLLQTGTPKI